MQRYNNSKYYLNKKFQLIKDFQKFLKLGEIVLKKHFDDLKIQKFIEESVNQYKSLISELPYIGGKKNSSTKNLIVSAWILAIIRSLEQENVDTRKIGQIIYELYEIYFKSKSTIMNKIIGKLMLSQFGMKKVKEKYQKDKFKQFPCGWATKFVEGDGITFDCGLDVTKCGICTFYKQQGAEKYIHYLCLGDYLMFKSLGIGFSRTQTLGNGGSKCDFRLKKGGCSPKGWPPEALEEWNGKN